MSEKTKRKPHPEFRAQARILKILEEFPKDRQLAILQFMAGQVVASQKYDAPVKPAQVLLGQENGLSFGLGE